ncbi:MAPEG family protein [Enterovirga rhinocerotis]|uniref:Putative MAPEG superfamily protein n=1 Tax=Enterovirga rhinocerotis TaxID=1339210 RepID=A0A4R7BME9_9HYPH|nr:putative MAPEG superfamily protein [Enterovirga rhinocerotis]
MTSSLAIIVVASVALLAFHIALQGIAATLELGSRWNAGPRDENLKPEGVIAGRAERALRNYLETFPAFGLLAATLLVLGRADGWGQLGAVVWIAARIVYVPLYLAGIPYLRSLAWIAAALGLTMMAWRVLV